MRKKKGYLYSYTMTMIILLIAVIFLLFILVFADRTAHSYITDMNWREFRYFGEQNGEAYFSVMFTLIGLLFVMIGLHFLSIYQQNKGKYRNF